MRTRLLIAVLLLMTVVTSAKKKKEVFAEASYGVNYTGTSLTIQFEKGKEHNHPLFAIWLADENGKFIQTLYVSESIGKGVFKRASRKTGQWQAGEILRPASLPYWAHQRGIKNEFGTYLPTPKQPEVDAYTGATPTASFILHLKTMKQLAGKYKVMLELNQTWDWNEFWTNDMYPAEKEYRTSCQPALVYEADIDTNNPSAEMTLKPIGHSHYSGADGSLTADLSTITTALKIAKKITVKID
ncbi:MAG TPA: hypothetical protein VFK73_07050 [Paludibacter sp.]|nr:hypothetical protein [Paludibacter sp.]